MWRRLLALLSCAAFVATANDLRGEAAFPFELRDGFIWVRVDVPQSREPLNFLLDTGAEVSTLNLQTARRLNLSGGRPVKVTGIGARSTGFWPQKLKATVGEVTLPNWFLVTDLCALQASCRCPVDGLLGADFFRNRIVQIDFEAKEIRLLASARDSAKGEQLPIRFRRNIPQVPVRVNGTEEQWLRLDTGCASALEWVSTGANKRRDSTKISIGLSSVRIPMTQTRVQLAKWDFDKVWTGIHSAPLFASEGGLLGLGLLSRFEQVTIDAKGGSLILSRRPAEHFLFPAESLRGKRRCGV